MCVCVSLFVSLYRRHGRRQPTVEGVGGGVGTVEGAVEGMGEGVGTVEGAVEDMGGGGVGRYCI